MNGEHTEKETFLLTVVEHYLVAALWTEEETLKEDYGVEGATIYDISKEDWEKATSDVRRFMELAGDATEGIGAEQLGHDIWLTRNGHGTGFWDRGYEQQVSDRLCAAADKLGSSDVYAGDDGNIYLS
jgi:hypothetical protein